MKSHGVKIFLLIYFITAAQGSFAGVNDPYVINSFRISARQLPLLGTDIIKNEAGKGCLEVDSVATIAPGKVIVRKKYDPGEYRMYEGYIDTAAFSREPPLYAFRIPDDISASQFVKKRVYSEIVKNHSSDIEEVYFDECSFCKYKQYLDSYSGHPKVSPQYT